MSSYKVIFFPKALKAIDRDTYSIDGQTEAQGTCPNCQYGWVGTAAWSHPADVQLSLAQQVQIRPWGISPGSTEHREHPPMQEQHPAQRCSQPCWGWGMQGGAQTGVSHSYRKRWAVQKWEGPVRPTPLPADQCWASGWHGPKDRAKRTRRKGSLKKCWKNQHGSV